MKKNKIMLAVALAVTLVGTGCGAKDNDTVVTQKETTVSTKDKKAEDKKDIKEIAKESADKTEEAGQDETEVKTEEAEDTQETVVADSKANIVNSSSNVEAGSNSGSNSNSTSGKNNTTASTNGRTTTTTNTGNNTTTSTATNTNNSTGNTSGNSTQTSTPTPAQHQHTWVHVEATGHNETVVVQAAWDEQVPVYGNVAHAICNQCGADITSDPWGHLEANMETCWAYHTEYVREQTGTQTIHHDAVTEQRWVQDTSAYDVCSGCGVTR